MELNAETVCGLILQARQFDGKEAATDPDSGSDPADTASEDVPYKDTLQDTSRDSIEDVLKSEIAAMNEEQQAELVALAWIGRGDYTAEEFDEAKRQARDRATDGPAGAYLLDQPMLGDLWANGLAAVGEPCRF